MENPTVDRGRFWPHLAGFPTRTVEGRDSRAAPARLACSVTMTQLTRAELDSVMDELSEHYDEWHLAGVGGSVDATGGSAARRGSSTGTEPDPALLAWIAALEHPDMIELRVVGVSLPGEGPWVDTPEGAQGVGL